MSSSRGPAGRQPAGSSAGEADGGGSSGRGRSAVDIPPVENGAGGGLPRVEAFALAGLSALPNASVLVFDAEFRYVLARGAALAQHGFSASSLEGRPAAEALGAERWAFYEPLYRAALQGETHTFEVRSPDEKCWYRVEVGPVRDRAGAVIGGASFSADVTARKQAELELIERSDELRAQAERLLASEELFRGGFEHSPIGMVLNGPDATIVSTNAAFASMLGYEDPAVLTGAKVWSFTHPDDLAADRARVRAMLDGHGPSVSEKRYVRRDGGIVRVLVASTVVRDAVGKPIVVFSQLEDVTERELAVAALVKRERLQRAVAELGRYAVGHPPYLMLLERAVAGVAQALGLELAAVLELQDDGALVLSAAVGFERDVIGTTIEGGAGSQSGYTLDAGQPVVVEDLQKEARFRPAALLTDLGVAASITVPISLGGEAYGVIGTYTMYRRSFSPDEVYFVESVANLLGAVRQRVDAQDKLARMKALLDRTQELSKVGGWQYEVSSGRVQWTDEVYRIYGLDRSYDPNDLEQNIAAYDADSAPLIDAAFKRAVDDREPYDLELGLVRADGERIWVRTIGRPVLEDGRVVRVGGNIVDITERKAAESARARLAAIVDCSQDAIIGKDLDGIITVWNPGAERLYGYSASEAIGRAVSLLVPRARLGEDRKLLDRVLAGERVEHHQTERVCKDGSVVLVSLSVSPLYDSVGRVTGASSIARDVTWAVRAQEQIALQAQLLDEVDAAVILTDAELLVRYWSRGAQQLYGHTCEEAIGRALVDLIVSEDSGVAMRQLADRAMTGQPAEGELDARDRQGRVFPVYIRLRATALGDGDATGIIGVSVDITARRNAEHAIRRHAEGETEIANLGRVALRGAPLEELFEHAVAVAARVLSADGACLVEHVADAQSYVVRAAQGWPEDRSGEHVAREDRSMFCAAIRAHKPIVVSDWDLEQQLERSDALLALGARSSVGVLVGDPEHPFGVLAVHYARPDAVPTDCLPFLDGLANTLAGAIQNHKAHDAIRHQGLHDELTGLPNRTLFLDRVTQALARNDRRSRPLAVFLIDIDHFKLVNNSSGHAAGDELLRLLAGRFTSAVRQGDTLARLGDDEFAVLCEELPSELGATRIAEHLINSLEHPVVLAGEERVASASIGIAISSPESTAAVLLRDAAAAVHHAKANGGGRAELFGTEMRDRILGRVRTEVALRAALTDDEQLFVHYQPLVSLRDGRIVGAEALARWRHPQWGSVSPQEFVAIAEDSGLIHELGACVLRQASRESAAWQHLPGFSGVAINISTRQLIEPDEVLSLIANAIASEDLSPGFFTVEITESVLIEHLDTVRSTLSAIKDLGVHVSLDDFGTGYSSISYLRELPLDSVKIDRSLIENMIDTPRAADLAAAIVDMGHALDLKVIAEGVETREQAALLQALGCDIAQGYYFAKPMAADKLTALLDTQPDWLPASATTTAGKEAQRHVGTTRRAASGIWMLDDRDLTSYADPVMAAILGCEPDQLLGKPIGDFTDPNLDGDASTSLRLNRLEADAPQEVRLRGLDGREVWAEATANPLPHSAGKYAGALVIVTDITERKANDANIAQLAALVESAGEAIITLAPTGEIVTWNQAAQRLYGYSSDEAIGQHASTLLVSDPATREPLLQAVARGEIAHVEGRDIRKGGDSFAVSVTGSPIRNADGRVVAIARIARDITERKAAESENARLAAIVECSQDAIIGKDLDGTITVWNPAAQRLYGYSTAEAIGRPVALLVPPARRGEDQKILDRVLDGERVEQFQTERVRKDGSVVTVSLSVSPVYDASGRVSGASSIARDVTSAVRAQEQIALQAELLDEVDAAVTLTDREGVVRYWSRGAQQLYGYAAPEAIGRKASDLMKLDENSPELLRLREDAVAGRPADAEVDVHDNQGRMFPVYIRERLVPLSRHGVPSRGLISVSVDITARRMSELAIRRHAAGQEEIADLGRLALKEASLDELFDAAVGAAWRVLGSDCAWLVECSADASDPVLIAEVGWPDHEPGEQIAGEERSLSGYVSRSHGSVVVEDWEQERRFPPTSGRLARGVRSSVGVRVGDPGSPFGVLEVHYTQPQSVPADCLPFLHALANILGEAIESRHAQEMISHQSDSLAAMTEDLRGQVSEKERLIEQIPGVVLVLDAHGGGPWRIVFVSRQCETILGVAPSELLGDASRFLSYVHLEDRLLPPVWQPVASTVDPLPAEYRFVRPDGKEVWLRGVSALVSRDDDCCRVQSVLFDITAAQQAERDRDRLELDLRLAQKLEAVGQLAAGVAHEINTPVQFIGNSVTFLKRAADKLLALTNVYHELLQSDQPIDMDEVKRRAVLAEEDADLDYLIERIPPALDRALDGIERVSAIIRAMREFAHPATERAPVDINAGIQTTLTVAKNEYKYVADIELDLGDLPLVMANASDLNQVFLNLIVNASHAIEAHVRDTDQRGKITVRTCAEETDVLIAVSDTGCGIPADIAKRVFDPFFTTKPSGRGTGQGLAIAHRIVVERNHGTIDFEPNPGGGTTFRVHLPRDAATADDEATEPTA